MVVQCAVCKAWIRPEQRLLSRKESVISRHPPGDPGLPRVGWLIINSSHWLWHESKFLHWSPGPECSFIPGFSPIPVSGLKSARIISNWERTELVGFIHPSISCLVSRNWKQGHHFLPDPLWMWCKNQRPKVGWKLIFWKPPELLLSILCDFKWDGARNSSTQKKWDKDDIHSWIQEMWQGLQKIIGKSFTRSIKVWTGRIGMNWQKQRFMMTFMLYVWKEPLKGADQILGERKRRSVTTFDSSPKLIQFDRGKQF